MYIELITYLEVVLKLLSSSLMGDRKIQIIDRTKSVKFTFNAASRPIGLRSLTLPK